MVATHFLKPGRGRALPLLTILLLTVAVSCGLPSYPALYPPLIPEFPTESSLDFTFAIPSGNNSSVFQGFEIYYKLYTDSDLETLDTELPAIIDFPTLLGHGYHRLLLSGSSSTEDQKPLVPSENDPDLPALIIDFSPLSFSGENASKYPSLTAGGETYTLARNAAEANMPVRRKGFSPDEFAKGEADVPQTFTTDPDSPGSRLFIAIFVLSYGVDIVANEFNIYSEPTYAGYIALPTGS